MYIFSSHYHLRFTFACTSLISKLKEPIKNIKEKFVKPDVIPKTVVGISEV